MQQWRQWGWLKPHKTDAKEIDQQLKLAAPELADAKVSGLSTDARFTHAYAAAFACTRAALYASGYEPDKGHSGRKYTVESLPFTVAPDPKLVAEFDGFRGKRHKGMYDAVGAVSAPEADAMVRIAEEFSNSVPKWIRANHPALLP